MDELNYLGSTLVEQGIYKGVPFQIRKRKLMMFAEDMYTGYIKSNDENIINEFDEVTFKSDGWTGFDTGHFCNTKEDRTYLSVKNKIIKMIDYKENNEK